MTPEQIYGLPSKSGEPWNDVAPAVIDGVFDLNYFSEVRDIKTTGRLIVHTKMEYVFDGGERSTTVKVLEFDGSPFAIHIASGEYNASGRAFVTDQALFDVARKYVIEGLHPQKMVKLLPSDIDFFTGYENAKIVQVAGVHKLVDSDLVSRKTDKLLFDEQTFDPYRIVDRTERKLSLAVTKHLSVDQKRAVVYRHYDDLIVSVFEADGDTYFAQVERIERVLVQQGHIEIAIRAVGPASFFNAAVDYFAKGRIALNDPAVSELQAEFALSAKEASDVLAIWLNGQRDTILDSVVEYRRSKSVRVAERRDHQREYYEVCKLLVERPERARYWGDSGCDLEHAKQMVANHAKRFETAVAG